MKAVITISLDNADFAKPLSSQSEGAERALSDLVRRWKDWGELPCGEIMAVRDGNGNCVGHLEIVS